MRAKSRSVAILAFFIFIILLRQATGAPNAQVAFAGNLGTDSLSVFHAEEKAHHSLASTLEAPDGSEEKAHYKKYISPEKLISVVSSEVGPSLSTHTAILRELSCPTAIPLEVLAHAPPFTEVTSIIRHHFNPEGENNCEHIDHQCSRGICLSGARVN